MMKYDPAKLQRRSIRIKGYDYRSPSGYFITLVTQGGVRLSGEMLDGEMHLSNMGQIADECWRLIPGHYPQVELDAFAIMPNHVHGIIILDERAATLSPHVGAQHVAPLRPHVKSGSLGAIIRAYKASVTRQIGREHGGPPDIWQRNYYEHIIRDDGDYKRIRLYCESNPLNWVDDDENTERR